jgi:hypothetical protein
MLDERARPFPSDGLYLGRHGLHCSSICWTHPRFWWAPHAAHVAWVAPFGFPPDLDVPRLPLRRRPCCQTRAQAITCRELSGSSFWLANQVSGVRNGNGLPLTLVSALRRACRLEHLSTRAAARQMWNIPYLAPIRSTSRHLCFRCIKLLARWGNDASGILIPKTI